MRGVKGFVSIDAFNFPAAKFFKPPLGFSKPQILDAAFNFIIERRDKSLRELDAISEREFHGISGELIKIGTHKVRIPDESVRRKTLFTIHDLLVSSLSVASQTALAVRFAVLVLP